MNCQDARRLLHRVLDDDISTPAHQRLTQHLLACSPCQDAEGSLKRMTVALESLAIEPVPSDFKDELMQQLPAPSRPWLASDRVRRMCAVAVLFLLIASPAFIWSALANPHIIAKDRQLILQAGDRFIVPAGQTVTGDVTIYKGVLVIDGQVDGNIKTVDAKIELGQSGQHSGIVQTIAASPQAKLAVAAAELWEKVKCFFVR